MKKLGVRVGNDLWKSIERYGQTAGLLDAAGRVDISETVRDLVSRGLDGSRASDAGYRSGYREGKLAGYGEYMQRLAAVAPMPTSARRK